MDSATDLQCGADGVAGSYGYGTFTIDAARASGRYTASTAHNEFVAGTTYTDTFTVASADGTASTMTVNILGTNDAAVVTTAYGEPDRDRMAALTARAGR